MNTHIFSTDRVYDVIKEGDVEKLANIWYSSLAQKNGAEIRDFIEQQLPQLAQRLSLPATNNFRKFSKVMMLFNWVSG